MVRKWNVFIGGKPWWLCLIVLIKLLFKFTEWENACAYGKHLN